MPCHANRDFGKYLDEVAKEKAWGSALEVMALSFTLDRPIFVLRPGQETYLFNRDGKRKPLYLKYQDERYTCLRHTGVSEPQLDTVIDGPHCGIRGAAATVVSSVGTRSTVKRRFHCPFQRNAKAPTSAGTRKSVQMNLKNVASNRGKRSQHVDTRSLDLPRQATVAPCRGPMSK